MLDVDNPKLKEAAKEIHKAMLSKVKRGGQVREDFVKENRIFSIICNDAVMQPREVAVLMEEKYDMDMTGDDVISVFRDRSLSNRSRRSEVLAWAEEVADAFGMAISGSQDAFEKFDAIRREPALGNGKHHVSQERIAAVMIYEKYPEIDIYNDRENLMLLGNTFAKHFFYDMADAVCEAYGFPRRPVGQKKQHHLAAEKNLTYEQAVRRLESLENSLERTNSMIQDLQEEFEEQLEASKVKELTDFFAKLNSEKYGRILDELLAVRKGVNDLRKNNYEVPIEINGLLIVIRKLIQFVRDSHIDPIMKVDSVIEVTASDIEFCDYEGTPFLDQTEKKAVKVISPGWVYKDKEIRISRPKVKEEER